MVAKAKPGQPNWATHRLPDLRSLERDERHPCPGEIPAQECENTALEKVLEAFGLASATCSKVMETHIGEVHISGGNLKHTVEKRSDARERYARYALRTIEDPFEIWKSSYDDETFRLMFIGAFQTRRQMLVVISIFEKQTLWNFMHTDAKSLNRHRHGELLYQKHKRKEAA